MSARHRPVDGSERDCARATDTELFAEMARGGLGPLGELFDRHHVAVRAFAQRLVESSADADDLVQETFLTASRAAGSFEASESAKPFLLGVAAQLARRRRRSFARLRAMLESSARVPSGPRPSPEDDATTSQHAAIVDEAIAALSDDHREIFLMVELAGVSGVDAAKALGVPAGTAWRKLHEARAEVREHVKRRTR